MRRVKCSISEVNMSNIVQKPTYYIFEGYFHKFVGGHMSAVEAIVELDDGRIELVPSQYIKFLDKPLISKDSYD